MKNIYITGAVLLILASAPLAAQKTGRVHRIAVVPDMADFESARGRSYLGVGLADLSSERVQALKLKDDHGVEVIQVDQDAPAGKAGLKEHDVIVAFNGTPVESQEQFKRMMRETPAGRTVSLDLLRDGQSQNVKVQLADRKKLETSVWPREPRDFAFAVPAIPAIPAMPDFPRAWTEQSITRIRSTSGVTVESLSPQLGDYFGVKNGEGMLVRNVQKGSSADVAGLRAGDVIVRVGDQKITDNADWREALRNGKNGKLSVVIVRDKKEQTLSLTVPLRKGSDSSALFEEDSLNDILAVSADLENLENAEPLVVEIEPSLEDEVAMGAVAAEGAVIDDESDINQAVKKAMEKLHRRLIENRGDGHLSRPVRLASAKLKSHSADIERALRQAHSAIDNMHTTCATELQ